MINLKSFMMIPSYTFTEKKKKRKGQSFLFQVILSLVCLDFFFEGEFSRFFFYC